MRPRHPKTKGQTLDGSFRTMHFEGQTPNSAMDRSSKTKPSKTLIRRKEQDGTQGDDRSAWQQEKKGDNMVATHERGKA